MFLLLPIKKQKNPKLYFLKLWGSIITDSVHSRGEQSQQMLLTDFCGCYCNIVPHVCLSVQWFGQRDPAIVHIDVELPLQICVSINEVPTKINKHQKFEPKHCCGSTTEASFLILGVLCLTGETCRSIFI